MKFEKLGNIAKISAGQGAPQKESDFSDTGIPFIRAGHLEELLNGKNENELPKINNEVAKKYKLKVYSSGTVVFAKSGMSATKSRIYKLKSDCHVVNHLAILEFEENVNNDQNSLYTITMGSMSLKRYYITFTVFGDYQAQFEEDKTSYYKYGAILSLFMDAKERSSINAKIERESKKSNKDTEVSFGFGIKL